ncbi:hypothetical protein [Bosea sp. RAC05]|uniref:hypothetical protein n=1 Tax=Bosea sp. RAC05 TaxID=1842539 RepID=UPI0012373590|nr:hypothetical protein [Bosea sp. RAC05]
MLVPDRRACKARRAELGQRDNVGRLVNMIGGVMPMDMARVLFVSLAILMGMSMRCDLGGEFRVPDSFGLRDGVGVVAGRDVHGRQRHAQRHRERDDEAGERFDAAMQHDEQIGTEILTEV